MRYFLPFISLLLLCVQSIVFSEENKRNEKFNKDIQQINNLGWNYLKKGLEENKNNIIISPVSLAFVFEPLLYGARERTLAEIEKTCATTNTLHALNEYYRDGKEGLFMSSLLLKIPSVDLKEEYLESVSGKFDLFTVDGSNYFREKSKSQDIPSNLEGLNLSSEELIKTEVLSSNRPMAALGICSFDRKWAHPFEDREDFMMLFHFPDEEKTIRGMIHSNGMPGKTLYQGPSGSEVVSLEYFSKNGKENLMFLIVLPKEGQPLDHFIKGTSVDEIVNSLKTKGNESHFTLVMPIFSIESPKLDLRDFMMIQGVKNLFNEKECDLSAMSESKGLHLASLSQKNTIFVNEFGTQAHSTSIGLVSIGIASHDINVNRPFLWFIYDQDLDLILFCGTCNKPSFNASYRLKNEKIFHQIMTEARKDYGNISINEGIHDLQGHLIEIIRLISKEIDHKSDSPYPCLIDLNLLDLNQKKNENDLLDHWFLRYQIDTSGKDGNAVVINDEGAISVLLANQKGEKSFWAIPRLLKCYKSLDKNLFKQEIFQGNDISEVWFLSPTEVKLVSKPSGKDGSNVIKEYHFQLKGDQWMSVDLPVIQAD